MNGTDTGSILSYVILTAVLFGGFLPMIAALSRHRSVLMIAAVVLNVAAIAAGLSGTVAPLAAMLIWPAAGALWFSGLLCGLVAFADQAADQRHHELQALLRSRLNPRPDGPEMYQQPRGRP